MKINNPSLPFLAFLQSSGLLVLGRAGFLFWEKRYRESFTLLGWTLSWTIIYLILVFIFLAYF